MIAKLKPHFSLHQVNALILGALLSLLLSLVSGCDMQISFGDDEREQTQTAIALQQTDVAATKEANQVATVEAGQATIQALSAAETAAALGPGASTPDLAATQTDMAIQGTMAAMQVDPSAQETNLAATQIALGVQQTMAAAGSTQGTPQQPISDPMSTVTYQAQPAFGGRLEDDFSDHTSWPVTVQPTYSTSYQESFYVIQVTAPRTDAFAVPGRWYPNSAVVETSAKMMSGTGGDRFGLICRYTDSNNFYAFTIYGNGNWAIEKHKNGVVKLLGSGWPEFSPRINTTGENMIEIVCIDDQLTLRVNGGGVATVTDGDFFHGDVGLFVGAGDDGYVSVGFDYIIADQ